MFLVKVVNTVVVDLRELRELPKAAIVVEKHREGLWCPVCEHALKGAFDVPTMRKHLKFYHDLPNPVVLGGSVDD